MLIQKMNGNNAKWLIERQIYPGEIIKFLKAGDIIPECLGNVKNI